MTQLEKTKKWDIWGLVVQSVVVRVIYHPDTIYVCTCPHVIVWRRNKNVKDMQGTSSCRLYVKKCIHFSLHFLKYFVRNMHFMYILCYFSFLLLFLLHIHFLYQRESSTLLRYFIQCFTLNKVFISLTWFHGVFVSGANQ